jgi:hypothetical protein
MDLTSPKLEEVIDQQLLILEQQLSAMTAVIDLIEADFRRLLDGGGDDELG